jgi:hypothetical protein
MAGQASTSLPLSSGGFFALGILLVLLGIDALFIPGYLVYKSAPIMTGGVAIAVVGLLAVFLGLRKPAVE